MDKNIGKKLDGRYEITELIGVGGMADVYKGVDVIDNKPVAVKILKKEFAENEEFLRRFRNESKAIAVLSHPNIVKIYDVGFSEKIQYIVMEYIDGITLKEYIEEEKVLTWKDTVHFVTQILRALQHAHDKGIVHRDIKPQNIMMFTDGTIKVMDFGIAKFAREEGKTATDQAIGSVHYISPEQAKGDVTDEKSDIYSVGAMMYEMLTGKKPFDSDNAVSIAVMHMHDIPERPRAVNPDIPDGLEEILLKAMEKNPDDRYQSTTDMIVDIETFKANPDITFGYYQEESDDSTRFFDAVNESEESEEPADNDNSVSDAVYDAGYGNETADNYDDYDYDDDEEEEEEQRSSLVVPVLTAAVVVVIIVAVIFVASLVSNMLKGDNDRGDFIMPDLVGMDYNDAVSKYGNNINIQENGYEYNEAESGTIIEQDLEPGTEFKKGDVVKVVISKGMETVTIPTGLTGMNAELAALTLKELGLVCEMKNSSSPDIEEGNVIRTEPEEGTVVDKGERILLYVSMGMDLDQIIVENFVGKTIEDATTIAEYAGLIPVPELAPSYEEEGVVFEQSIKEGETVEAGTEITLYVSNGVLPEGEIPFRIPFPQDAYGRFVIDFIIRNEDGTTNTISSNTLPAPEVMASEMNIAGAGENVYVIVTLTNMNNYLKSTIGEYRVDFANMNIQTIREDITAAFVAVDGLFVETTTAPVTTTTTTTTTIPVTTTTTTTTTQATTTTTTTAAPTDPPSSDENEGEVQE